jgi:ribosome biogenesis GTPase
MARRTLEDLGWNKAFAKDFKPYASQGWVPARLIRDNKISYGALVVERGKFEELNVIMSGKVYHDAESDAELPAVGDWVALDVGDEQTDHVIRARLPRQSCLARKVPGDSSEAQVMATNITCVVIVTEAGPDFNLRRMERYFALISRSGAEALVLINKSDLAPKEQNQEAVDAIRSINPDVDIHVTSAIEGKGLRPLKAYLKKGSTICFVGSSGVGKSALINHLLGGEYQWTAEVNEVTRRGRHTTTARELMVLRQGGIVIDNPGIREVQMWTDETTLRERFLDIEALAQQCKYHDCKHGSDAGCAIRAAVENDELDPERLEGFLKLDEEIAHLRKRRKKRQMTIERIAKRTHRVKARNPADRRTLERDFEGKLDDD